MGYRMTIIKNLDDRDDMGTIVEKDHADVAKLVIIGKNGMFDITELASTTYIPPNQNNSIVEILLLTEAANKLGYKLVRQKEKIL